MTQKSIKEAVRERYAAFAEAGTPCCAPSTPCCGSSSADKTAAQIGYTHDDIRSVPEGANLGLGCGNPVALASLREGEVVLDLGSGAGFDCFLASAKVGRSGRVIGVDMTPEMVEKARKNASKGGFTNVEFRLGEIEHLPVADASVDAVISNCVINLAPDKTAVFRESHRVLKPGGRLMVSDIVLIGSLPDDLKRSVTAYVGCVAGAERLDDYLSMLRSAGFSEARAVSQEPYPIEAAAGDPFVAGLMEESGLSLKELRDAARVVVSTRFSAVKPA